MARGRNKRPQGTDRERGRERAHQTKLNPACSVSALKPYQAVDETEGIAEDGSVRITQGSSPSLQHGPEAAALLALGSPQPFLPRPLQPLPLREECEEEERERERSGG